MPRIRKTVELDSDNVEWFQDTYAGVGGQASLSWLMDLMLAKFREAHDKTPAQLAEIGAQELKRLLEEKV